MVEENNKLYLEPIDSDEDEQETDTMLVDHDVEGDGGVLKTTVKRGTGYETPEDGADVEVHYTGYLLDGTKFDSSKDRGRPFRFKIGAGQVIKGWDVAVTTMRLSEQATFVLKPEYAYGANGRPPKIPPNATLKFEIELLSFKNEIDVMGDGDILLNITKQGDGLENPNDGGTATFHYAYRRQGDEEPVVSTFGSEPITVTIGEEMLPPGLDKAIIHLSKGAAGTVVIQPGHYMVQKKNCVLKDVPDDSMDVYVFDLELVDYTRVKEGYEQSGAERIETARSFKDRGNHYYKEGQYALAVTRYARGLQFVERNADELSKDEKKECQVVKSQCLLNSAASKLKLGDLMGTLQDCEDALEIDNKNVKALYRKGEALFKMQEFAPAISVLERALELDPDNASAKTLLAHANKGQKKQVLKEKKMYANMFK